MPASAATPAPSSKPSNARLKPNKEATSTREIPDDADMPSTSSASAPTAAPNPSANPPPQRTKSERLHEALEMLNEFDRNAQHNYRQNILQIQHKLLERIDGLISSLTTLAPSPSNWPEPPGHKEERQEATTSLKDHLICLQNAAFAARDLAAQQAVAVFEKIGKHRPEEVKVKRGKTTKKDRKEKDVPSSSKSDRTSQREKAPPAKAQPQAPTNSDDATPETPVTTNNRVVNKRKATQTPTSTPTEKKSKKENGVKKRTSNRLSKTPRVKAKEEDEPTYCFCSRISFGEMIGCDNEKCEIEWFHFECIGLTTKPKGKWFCPNCRHPDSARMPKASRAINANNRNNAAVEKV
ncbi:hypothetical protein V3C99_000813 [Haemonchus contortus]